MDACAAHPDGGNSSTFFLTSGNAAKASDWGEMAGINVWATQIKSLTRRLRRSTEAKEGRKMINCDYSYIVTILLILLAVAACLLTYALCVVSGRADEMIDSMYREMILHTDNKDNHSHWEK